MIDTGLESWALILLSHACGPKNFLLARRPCCVSAIMAFSHRDKALQRTFDEIITGKPITKYNAVQFLESVYSRPDPASCMDKIIASCKGLGALQQAIPTFFNDQATPLLNFFQAPDLKIINGGLYLNRFVLAISEPHIF